MKTIEKKVFVLELNEIEDIIKEHFKNQGYSVYDIEFFGDHLNYFDRDDYLGHPKFKLNTVICKEVKSE